MFGESMFIFLIGYFNLKYNIIFIIGLSLCAINYSLILDDINKLTKNDPPIDILNKLLDHRTIAIVNIIICFSVGLFILGEYAGFVQGFCAK
jgi:hypothetical protein